MIHRIVFFISLFFPLIVGANMVGGDFSAPPGTINLDGGSLASILTNVISYAIGVAGILAVIGVTWGGISMVLASGDDEKFKKSRHIIIYSLIGVGLAGAAYGLVTIISSLRIN